MLGGVAKEPIAGDWPVPMSTTQKEWEKILFHCRISNEELIRVCEGLNEADWNTAVVDDRDQALGSGVSHAELLNGLIQHHAYHSGQIGLLLKFSLNPFLAETF